MGRGLILGAVIAAGALLLIPGVAAAAARAARPIVRSALKNGSKSAMAVQQSFAEAYEHIEDVVAEVRADLDAERESAPFAPARQDADHPAPALDANRREI